MATMTFEEKISYIFRLKMSLMASTFDIKDSKFFQDNKEEIMQIYKELLTEEDIDGLISFYSSDCGKTLLKKLSELNSRLKLLIINKSN
jgi:hypothetical protein